MSETPFPVSAPPPDAASLAALLQSAAQALLRSGTPSEEEHPAPAKVERIQEEIRHYRFPPLAVRCEKELLEAEDAEEMQELLFRAFSSLETFADLLELMNPRPRWKRGDAYAGSGIAAYRQIGVQDPRRLQHRGACGSIARPRQYKLPNG